MWAPCFIIYTEALQPSVSIKNIPQRLALMFCLGQRAGANIRSLCRIALSREFTATGDFVQSKRAKVPRKKKYRIKDQKERVNPLPHSVQTQTRKN